MINQICVLLRKTGSMDNVSMSRGKQLLTLKIENGFLQNCRKLSTFLIPSRNKVAAPNVKLSEVQKSIFVFPCLFLQKNDHKNAQLIIWWDLLLLEQKSRVYNCRCILSFWVIRISQRCPRPWSSTLLLTKSTSKTQACVLYL